MVTIAQKFIQCVEDRLRFFDTRKEAFMDACNYWRNTYQFEPPYKSYDSFKSTFSYYYHKKSTVKNITK